MKKVQKAHNNLSLDNYYKKYRNYNFKLLKLDKNIVDDFDRKHNKTNNFLLKGKKWALINNTYYEIPKAPRWIWFRNLKTGVQIAMGVLLASVIAVPAAFITDYIITNRNIHVILIAGQSNAIGWSFSSEVQDKDEYKEYNKQSRRQKILFNNFGKTYIPGLLNWNDDFENVKYGQGLTEYEFGMEIGFSKVLREKKPRDNYYFIKYAMNSSTVNEDWKIGTDFYNSFINFVSTNVNKLRNNHNVTVEGLMWMQGENDADGYDRNPDKYGENLKKIFEDIRNIFNKNMIIVDAGISNCIEWVDYEKINEQKRKLDNQLNRHYYFDTIEMGLTFFDSGQMHYDGPSMLKLGEKFAITFLNNL